MGSRRSLGSGFRALFVGSLISNLGDGMRLAALPLLATSLTSSPVLIAAVTSAQYLPWLVFAPVGAALVDRWDRRQTIVVTQTWRGAVLGVLAVLVVTSNAELWHLCIVAFLLTAGEILVDPSTVALVPTLVDEDDLDRANGRISSAEIATNDVAGAPVGAALFALAPWLPFLIDAVSYVGSVGSFRGLPKPERSDASTSAPTSIAAEAAEGFRWLRGHPVLGPLTASLVVYYFSIATSLSLLVVLAKDELAGSDAAFGLVLAAGAVGAFLGTLVGATAAARLGQRTVLTGAVVLQAVTVLAAAASTSVGVLGIAWFLNGIPIGAARPISRTLQQRLTPNHLLGRVNVTSRIFTRGIIVVGSLTAGAVASIGGVRMSFVLAGLILVLAAVMMWRSLSRIPNASVG